MLFYCGKQVGIKRVVPSMKLKWLRKGVEDYEYLEMLKSCVGVARRRHRQERSLSLPQPLHLD